MTKEEIRQKAIECGKNFGTMCASNRCADNCSYTGLERCSAVYSYEHGFADGFEEGKRQATSWISEEPIDVIWKNGLCFCPKCKRKLRYRNSNGCRRTNLGKFCEECGTRINYTNYPFAKYEGGKTE